MSVCYVIFCLDCIDDAMEAQKMFSDFFDTTEAENELQLPKPTKRIRKTKKLPVKMVQRKAIIDDSSDSEMEQGKSGSFFSFSLLNPVNFKSKT